MTEKVLGIKANSDIFIFEKKKNKYILVEKVGDKYNSGNIICKLVPVVSLEALEQVFTEFLVEVSLSDDGELRKLDFGTVQQVGKRKISWAKKESGKK